MPTKAEIREAYEARLAEHPAVKALRLPRRPPSPVRPGLPKVVVGAMEDPDVATAVVAMRRVMKYHRRAGDVVRRHLKGEKIPLNDQQALIRKGENIESDFQEAAQSAAKAALKHPATEAYAAAIAGRPDDTEVIDNLPSFLSRSAWAAVKYLGLEREEVIDHWERFFKPCRKEMLEGFLPSGSLNKTLRRLEQSAVELEYREAPRHLVEQGIITLGGDGGGSTTTNVIGVSALVIGTALIWYSYTPWGVATVSFGACYLDGQYCSGPIEPIR